MQKDERLRKTKIGMIPYTKRKCRELRKFVDDCGGMEILEELTDRQKEVFLKRILEEKNHAEIAKELGGTQQGISFTEEAGKKKLKKIKNQMGIIY